jgi:excisionase family DNA binding protein
MEEPLYTVKQVAERLGVHRTTVYDWMRSYGLRYVYVGPRRRIPQSALEEFIRAGVPAERQNQEQDTEEITMPSLAAA